MEIRRRFAHTGRHRHDKGRPADYKIKTKAETDRISARLLDSDELKEKIKVDVPRRRRNRVLLLSVDVDVNDAMVTSHNSYKPSEKLVALILKLKTVF